MNIDVARYDKKINSKNYNENELNISKLKLSAEQLKARALTLDKYSTTILTYASTIITLLLVAIKASDYIRNNEILRFILFFFCSPFILIMGYLLGAVIGSIIGDVFIRYYYTKARKIHMKIKNIERYSNLL